MIRNAINISLILDRQTNKLLNIWQYYTIGTSCYYKYFVVVVIITTIVGIVTTTNFTLSLDKD